jgi:hypothetical protein
MTATEAHYRLPAKAVLLFGTLTLVGAVALVMEFLQTPPRAWIELFVIGNYLVGLGLGALLLVALFYVTGARWSIPVRRIAEALTAVLPLAALALAAVLIGWPSMYSTGAPGEVSESSLQHMWRDRPFFLVRSLVYLAVWLFFALAIVRNSRRQDEDTDPGPTRKNLQLSAFFLVAFGVTCWLASQDWIMALEPDWASTIFGVYYFAGLFLSALAAVAILVIGLRRSSPLHEVVSADHLHDLGTLLFSFSSFWMYTWFCQYLLIWYVNNPEETIYLRRRSEGDWPFFLFVDLALNWGVPFVVLLFRSAKRSPAILGTVALLVLIGRWVDLCVMILPSQKEAALTLGPVHVGFFVGMIGLVALISLRSLSKASLVPLHDPLGWSRPPLPAKS